MLLFVPLLAAVALLSLSPPVLGDGDGYIRLDAAACPQPITRQPFIYVVGTADTYAPVAATSEGTYVVGLPSSIYGERGAAQDIKLRIFWSDADGKPGTARGLDRPNVLIDLQDKPTLQKPSTIKLSFPRGYKVRPDEPALVEASFADPLVDPYNDYVFNRYMTVEDPIKVAIVSYCRRFAPEG